jgi:hypothetical protein
MTNSAGKVCSQLWSLALPFTNSLQSPSIAIPTFQLIQANSRPRYLQTLIRRNQVGHLVSAIGPDHFHDPLNFPGIVVGLAAAPDSQPEPIATVKLSQIFELGQFAGLPAAVARLKRLIPGTAIDIEAMTPLFPELLLRDGTLPVIFANFMEELPVFRREHAVDISQRLQTGLEPRLDGRSIFRGFPDFSFESTVVVFRNSVIRRDLPSEDHCCHSGEQADGCFSYEHARSSLQNIREHPPRRRVPERCFSQDLLPNGDVLGQFGREPVGITALMRCHGDLALAMNGGPVAFDRENPRVATRECRAQSRRGCGR